jgi:hypothetical protein
MTNLHGPSFGRRKSQLATLDILHRGLGLRRNFTIYKIANLLQLRDLGNRRATVKAVIGV